MSFEKPSVPSSENVMDITHLDRPQDQPEITTVEVRRVERPEQATETVTVPPVDTAQVIEAARRTQEELDSARLTEVRQKLNMEPGIDANSNGKEEVPSTDIYENFVSRIDTGVAKMEEQRRQQEQQNVHAGAVNLGLSLDGYIKDLENLQRGDPDQVLRIQKDAYDEVPDRQAKRTVGEMLEDFKSMKEALANESENITADTLKKLQDRMPYQIIKLEKRGFTGKLGGFMNSGKWENYG
jgi:hypothetical protein